MKWGWGWLICATARLQLSVFSFQCGSQAWKSGIWGQPPFLLNYLAFPSSRLSSQAYGGFRHLVNLLSNPEFPSFLFSFFPPLDSC